MKNQDPSSFADRVEIARPLNRGGLSAAPLEHLAAISIFDDEEYENYDFDIITPRRRWRIAKLLKEIGYRQKWGSKLVPLEGGPPVLIPKPGILGSDPSRPAALLLAKAEGIVLTTPTQSLLLYLHHLGAAGIADGTEELSRLVWEQPANLEKVRDWARAAGLDSTFKALRRVLEPAQAEGIELRRQRRFRSRLPK